MQSFLVSYCLTRLFLPQNTVPLKTPSLHALCNPFVLQYANFSISLHSMTVYLRSSPEVCYQRLQQRGRKEEKPVTLVRIIIIIIIVVKEVHNIMIGLSQVPS